MASPQAEKFCARMLQFQREVGESGGSPESFRKHSDAMCSELGIPFDVKLTPVKQVRAAWADEPGVAPKQRVLLYVHGGGFICGSAQSHARFAVQLGRRIDARPLLAEYRLAPEHQFPLQIEDCADAYEWLIESGVDARDIVFAGDSAGGNLAITAQLMALRRGLPAPAATFAMSPLLDFEASGASYEYNANKDLFANADACRMVAGAYLGAMTDLRNPVATPLFADLSGISPLYVQVGGDEVLVEDSVWIVDRAKAAGVVAELDVVPEMQHLFQTDVGVMPEGTAGVDRGAAFLRRFLR